MSATVGTLYLCGTPIGNLEDVTLRLTRILGTVPLVAAEDTRRSRQLLDHLGHRPDLISYHAHNARARLAGLLAHLEGGQDLALVTDAGMPGISDPGSELVAAAIERHIPIVVVPGPVAAISALVASGLPTDRWAFEGFLPQDGTRRRRRLRELAREARTVIFYEAPHRILDTLVDLETCWGPDRRMSAGRELTKQFEEHVRGTVAEVRAHFEAHAPRGEFTLVVGGAPRGREAGSAPTALGGTIAPDDVPGDRPDAWHDDLRAALALGLGTREASKQVARRHGLPPRTVYAQAVAWQSEDPA
ncbi:MAG: 16S rRNA (cytidine(1402)-2'-O)-methyltransferase [bacterium]|nr:16S rRNA (cytidine(1402)-2'-O)-methyltransferase [bacterium]